MTPRFYHRLEKAFKQVYLVPLTLLRYKSLRPHRAKLHGCDNWIYIDPTDPCAIKKVVQEPLRRKVSSNLIFWREFNAHLKPDLVADVGLNYGECLFGTNYSATTSLWGFEANPRLMPHLERSRQAHPDGARMTLTNCLVSDVPTEGVPFLVNPQWSGQSSAVREVNATDNALRFELPARPLDAVIPVSAATDKTMLFKMDIEGYESRALAGFEQTQKRVKMAIGLIEFTPKFIRWAGVEPEKYFAWLQERYDVFCIQNLKRRELVSIESYEQLPARHGQEFTGTDLLLATKQRREDWIPSGWFLRR